MEYENHLYNNIVDTRVFIVGRNNKKINKIKNILENEYFECNTITWNEIQRNVEGVYVFCDPPKGNYEKQLYQSLINENNYIISLFRINNTRKEIQNHLLYLPAMNNLYIIKNIIKWIITQKDQEIKLKKFREELQNRREEWISELALANELQKSLLPRNISKDLPINFTHRYLPHAYIGGDFFDIIRFDNNRIGIIIADVSGHGAAAAFITAMLKSSLDHFPLEKLSPAQLLSQLNDEFFDHIREHYITAFYSIIDTENMNCTYCNAGHPKQLLIHNNGKMEELKASGFFIGMFKNIVFEDRITPLYPGDRLIFFTDGIIGVRNTKDELFGLKTLKRHIKKGKDDNITSLSNNIIDNVIMHMKENRFPDDITLLIAEMIEDI